MILLRTLAFTVAYTAATYAGRQTVMDETNLSLVWPAAGVSAVWAAVQYRSRWLAVDALALSAVTVGVNMATGAPVVLTLWFVVANLVQAWLFAWLLNRWVPHLWGGGGVQPLARLADLWRVTAAAFLSTAGGATIGPTGMWAVTGVYSWSATAVWLTRNTVSILLIGVACIRIGAVLSERRRSLSRAGLRRWWAAVPVRRQAEYLTLVTASAGAYTAVFGLHHHLPLAFCVIGLTIWAGSRLHTVFVVLHDLVFGSVAILFTLHGSGVFAAIASHPARAMVAQAFVGMLALVGLSLAVGRDERDALVGQLRAAEQAAAGQARMMGAIVDSMAEGLTVVDEQGLLLLRNPAVRRLVGGVVSTSDRMAHPDYYGLFHPDGRPLGPEEMPYRRALAGAEVRNMDVLVRNAGVPDGRILSVSSTALPEETDGTRYAVTVFHDVTAERRHRDELASFAGVVAHDLQNPLATVQGWSETLTEMIEETGPAAAPLADPVRRISQAAARMRNLINDLLEYTTARDATVSAGLIDLGDLINDIAMGRIDQAQSNGTPVPTFLIGELRPVYADPVLVRQLLENLIGNAIKYTAPGVVPRIVVGTAPDARMVTVTIDDNGIGIPEGQHQAVFDNFHRAHHGDGYSGTGLGLGICKRIVERHGGTIRVEANPAGPGSRFAFTLPADGMTAPQREPEESVPSVVAERQPAVMAGEPAPPAAAFSHAAHLVLDFLHEQVPLSFWSITRVENGRQTYLYLDTGNGYGLRQGASHPWEDSLCVHMVTGEAPPVAPDTRQVPAYATAGVTTSLEIGTYAGAVITEPDGSLFGGICGLDPRTHAGDPRLTHAEPLLRLLGRLLTTVLAADRAQDNSVSALLREQLSAETDALTGLPNRRAWQRLVEQSRIRFEHLADPTVVAMLDLDRLKIINDSQGHAAGDAYLAAAAIAMRRALRDTDVVARLGGDEFGFLLRKCTENDAPAAVSRVYAELEAVGVAGSIGWAAVSAADGFAAAIEEADTAMYATKIERRRQWLTRPSAPPPG